MSKHLNRRNFLKKSIFTTTGIAAGLSMEENILAAAMQSNTPQAADEQAVKGLQTGKIGNLTISRLICGGNLINGYAHSRDLIYVSELVNHYFTDQKVFETLRIAEENGINTCIMNVASPSRVENTTRLLKQYWNGEGGKIQWIAQCDVYENDVLTNIKRAVDNGAVGAFIQGNCGDKLVENNRIDIIDKAVSFAKENGLVAGVGGHSPDVPITVEKEKIDFDFHFKTLNNDIYWSTEPDKLIEFMKTIKKPWIAYKVLAAGVVDPRKGFRYAFENGADFINIGMYDFQVKNDALMAKREISRNEKRIRPWMG